MAKGYAASDTAAADAAARKERFENTSGVQVLRAKQVKEGLNGLPLVVRFCEQGNEGPYAVNTFKIHEYKEPSDKAVGGFFVKKVTCFSEIGHECAFCRAGLPQKVNGAYNLIQRNRPVLRKGQDGKAIKQQDGSYIIDGYADQVVVFVCSNTTVQTIKKLDNDIGGLMSRDVTISPSGNSFDPYSFFPVDIGAPAAPMSEEDQALLAKRHDLDKFMAPPTLQEAATIITRYGANSGMSSPSQGIPVAVPPNGFAAQPTVPAGAPFGAAQQPPPPVAPPQVPVPTPSLPQQ